jgi:hypothetical protein
MGRGFTPAERKKAASKRAENLASRKAALNNKTKPDNGLVEFDIEQPTEKPEGKENSSRNRVPGGRINPKSKAPGATKPQAGISRPLSKVKIKVPEKIQNCECSKCDFIGDFPLSKIPKQCPNCGLSWSNEDAAQ